MQKQLERRAFLCDELRADGADNAKKIRGHAAVFNSKSESLGGFREIIAPGAFSEAIQKDDVRMLWNHNPDYILGRNRAKPTATLRLEEDAKGLLIENDPPDTQFARDLLISIERGDVSQMSFGFYTLDEKWEKQGGENLRTVLKVRLFDVSPVTYPAYTKTDVSVRSYADILAEGERALKDPEAWRVDLERRRRYLELAAAE